MIFLKTMLFYIIAFFISIGLLIITRNFILSITIVLIGIFAWHIIVSSIRSKRRSNLLNEKCDPESYIKATEKQQSILRKDLKMCAYLNINKSAGLISQGEFYKAKELLMSIDKSYLSNVNGTLLIYTLNLIYCAYLLGEFSYAEELFEKQIPLLSPTNKKMTVLVKILIAIRLFYLNRYEESEEHFFQVLKEKISTKKRLEIVYMLAQIDENKGQIESARDKYKEVAEQGNKLFIATQAKQWLKNN